mgnify:FL=1
MKKYSKLSWRKNFDQGSNFKVEREYFEILINGKSINQILGSWGNLCGIFGRFGFEHDKQIINQHFLKGKPELDSGRIIISSCNHCGDIGCGALTFKLIIGKDIIWKDFRYEVDHDDDTVNQQYDKKKGSNLKKKNTKNILKI